MSAHATPLLTPEQYLEIERASKIKSEYHGGQTFAMSGGTLPHSRIAVKLTSALLGSLDGKDCGVVNSDLRVRIAPGGPFVYPAAAVYRGQPQLADGYSDMLLNPTVVFEVLSETSEAHDRGYKFAQYRKIPSLREYMLISRTEARIEVFLRQSDDRWVLTEYVGQDAVCRLSSIGCNIALADCYQGVTLEAGGPPLN